MRSPIDFLRRFGGCLVCFALLVGAANGEIIRVMPDVDEAGVLVGDSWANATNLQRAVEIANNGDEIWVASGLYPSRLEIRNHLSLYGGFVGAETTRAERPAGGAPSILSGDLGGDDLDGGDGIVDSRAQIVGSNSNVIIYLPFALMFEIDGFTITAGGRDDSPTAGGIHAASGGEIAVSNCAFMGNHIALKGASGETLAIEGCSFVANENTRGGTQNFGGAVVWRGDELAVEGCVFERNETGGWGGAISAENGVATIYEQHFCWQPIPRSDRVGWGCGIAQELDGHSDQLRVRAERSDRR